MKKCPICGSCSEIQLTKNDTQLAWYCTSCNTPFGGAELGWVEWEPLDERPPAEARTMAVN